MNFLLCLGDILSDFRHLFNQQSFALFQAFIFRFIANRGSGTLTGLYQSGASETKYWSFPKLLSREKWSADAVAALLIKRLQGLFDHWVYVYDDTKARKTGKSEWGLHFFSNSSYQKHRVHQWSCGRGCVIQMSGWSSFAAVKITLTDVFHEQINIVLKSANLILKILYSSFSATVCFIC